MFENEYILTSKIVKEYVYNGIMNKGVFILGIMLSLISFLGCITSKKEIFFFLGLAIFITTFYTSVLCRKTIEKKNAEFHKDNQVQTRIKFSDKITLDEGSIHLEVPYANIKKIIQTKNLILLKIGQGQAIVVLKEGFKKKTPEEFLTFITQKTKENQVKTTD